MAYNKASKFLKNEEDRFRTLDYAFGNAQVFKHLKVNSNNFSCRRSYLLEEMIVEAKSNIAK